MATKGETRRHCAVIVFVAIVLAIVLVGVIVLIFAGYKFDWTGFNSYTGPKLDQNQQYRPEKTLWDWLQLLIVPLVLAIGGFWLGQRQKTTEQRSTTDNQRAAALQAYINEMSELLLHEKLRESAEDDEVRTIARVRTLTVLRGLDSNRKASVIQFLHESGLIDKDKHIINLSGADLSGVNLFSANLREANFSGANLNEAALNVADLSGANFSGANLSWANLFRANFSGANLNEADLLGADLRKANLNEADLRKARLYEANLRDANLSGADLSGANLCSARLRDADFREANLNETNFREARVTGEQLNQAKSLKGAIISDWLKYP